MPKRLTDHPAWLEYDAFAEADGLGSKAFLKMAAASRAWEQEARAWENAFVEEFLAHHKQRGSDKLTPACKAAQKHFPKYRKRDK